MSQTHGVGGTSPESGKVSQGAGGLGEDAAQVPIDTQFGTLDQLRQMLISHLGEEQGQKMYDSFMKTIYMSMMQQMQQASDRAKQAAQNMRMNL